MYKKDMNDELTVTLRHLGRILQCRGEGRGSQRRVLAVLVEYGSMTQRALTEHLGIQPGSVSEVLAKLEQAGLIRRTPNPEDHRTMDVVLTKAGEKQGMEVARNRARRQAEMFSCLSEPEKQELLRLMEILQADWDVRYEKNGQSRVMVSAEQEG